MQSGTIDQENLKDIEWDENYFKFCDFENFSIEGKTICSDFVNCSFNKVEWYWGLFSGSNFIDCLFTDCTFRGSAFPDSKFVECRFTNCHFLKDNLGEDCDFSKTIAYGCLIEGGGGFKIEIR